MSRTLLAALGVIAAVLVAAVAVLAIVLFATAPDDGSRAPSDLGTSTTPTPSPAVRTADEADHFPVEDGALAETDDGTAPGAQALELWELFRSVTGDDASRIVELAVYHDPGDTSMASVARDEDDAQFWYADANTAWADDRDELEHTVVHEFGHMLTLSAEQVPDLASSCPTFELSEGCAAPDALITAFRERFWAAYGDEVPSDDGADEDEVSAFFRAHGGDDAFVSEYAATNLAEDVAESWAEYVLSDEPGAVASGAGAQSGTPEWSQKVRLFEEFPALVAQRERIRTALGYA